MSDVTRAMPADTTVSVVILNYNRKDLVVKAVAEALEIEWPALEVIMVDNASTDGSADAVEQQFGDAVRIIRRTFDSPTAGRNEGFQAAKGRFVLSLDNDIFVTDKAIVRKAMRLFESFPRAGALAFRISSPENPAEPTPSHWWHPLPLKDGSGRFFYTDFFCEGAVFFRAEALAATGGYDEDFWGCYESSEMTLRLIRDGFDIVYCPTLASPEQDVSGVSEFRRSRSNYYFLRNKLWTAWKHYPLWRALSYALPRTALGAWRALRYGWFDYFVDAVKDGVFAPPAIRRQRRPLSPEVWGKIAGIRRGCLVEAPPVA